LQSILADCGNVESAAVEPWNAKVKSILNRDNENKQ